jgi:hypothetical protein
MTESNYAKKTPARQNLAERILAFTRIKLPAWLVLLLLIFHQIPGWKEDIDFWIDVAKHSGGFFALVAAAVSSPFFTPVLAMATVIYLVVVGQPKNFVQRHPAWAVLGWSVFVICTSAVDRWPPWLVCALQVAYQIRQALFQRTLRREDVSLRD